MKHFRYRAKFSVFQRVSAIGYTENFDAPFTVRIVWSVLAVWPLHAVTFRVVNAEEAASICSGMVKSAHEGGRAGWDGFVEIVLRHQMKLVSGEPCY